MGASPPQLFGGGGNRPHGVGAYAVNPAAVILTRGVYAAFEIASQCPMPDSCYVEVHVMPRGGGPDPHKFLKPIPPWKKQPCFFHGGF